MFLIHLPIRISSLLRHARTMSSFSPLPPTVLETLYKYTACDISDALLKLKVPGAGFLSDLIPITSSGKSLAAPASTVLFIPKTEDGSAYPQGNIPAGAHWVDLAPPHTIVVESQPEGQKNAVLGGIMAARMKVLKVQGVVVHGRVRDIEELKDSGLPVPTHFLELPTHMQCTE